MDLRGLVEVNEAWNFESDGELQNFPSNMYKYLYIMLFMRSEYFPFKQKQINY